eukprot:TRINITY_DN779_c0_g1::TRINITY_DN779_c0_g1_i1::g.18421::m.18421 TRINITY_DN779_c0_g1::TRINITY_DN779_c0_g1_i1::g.18421  ORF type:complete len:669 (+),score=115.52,sp/Q55B06/SPXS1_DICDI/29.11/3e-80,EXS/PF03124.9/1.9e-74,SPX/PF03105.14/1e-12,SPX/PF03105.14/0.00027 TRINITY_DN779_c0_g1_i1:66-2072(+)
MGHFSNQFDRQIVIEWSKEYIGYRRLKKILRARVRRRKSERSYDLESEDGGESADDRSSVVSIPLLPPYEESGNPVFLNELDADINKIERFYLSKLSELGAQWELLKEQAARTPVSEASRSSHSLKRAFVDLYRQSAFLQNYHALNYSAIVNLLRLYDKRFPVRPMYTSFVAKVDARELSQNPKLAQLMKEIEELYARLFTHQNVHLARSDLLMKQQPPSNWHTFLLGLRCGVTLTLFFWALWDCVVDASLRDTGYQTYLDNAIPVYHSIGCLVLLMWLWGMKLYVFSCSRINYLYIFDMTEKDWLAHHESVFSEAVTCSNMYLINFLVFYKVARGDFPEWIPLYYFPLMLYLYMIFKLTFPWRKRKFFFIMLLNIVISPFGAVTFREWYGADILTSMAKVLTGLGYSTCFFVTGDFLRIDMPIAESEYCSEERMVYGKIMVPLMCALPLWFRMMQCFRRYTETQKRWPYLANAFKYAFAHTCVMFGAFHHSFKDSSALTPYKATYITFLALSTLYTYAWDVKCDWGLMQKGAPYPLLRERVMFKHVSVYYVAIFFDLFMRFMWTLTLVPSHQLLSNVFSSLPYILPVVELVRRSMWGCLRLEYEHLSNSLQFRNTDFIPLHFETPTPTDKAKEIPVVQGYTVLAEVAAATLAVVILAVIAAATSTFD